MIEPVFPRGCSNWLELHTRCTFNPCWGSVGGTTMPRRFVFSSRPIGSVNRNCPPKTVEKKWAQIVVVGSRKIRQKRAFWAGYPDSGMMYPHTVGLASHIRNENFDVVCPEDDAELADAVRCDRGGH